MTTIRLNPAPAGGAAGQNLPAGPRRWIALPVILAGTFMVTLDFFIVNVAIPSMQHGLRADSGTILLVVAGYGLAYAAGLIPAGRLGDLYGRRRMFVLGLALFTVASAVCGAAPTPELLVLARVVQGLAAALLSPQVLAMLGVVYTGDDRARAFNAYGMVLGIAAVGGQLIGGLLIAADVAGLQWRTCFLINVPVGIAALLLTPRLLPETRAQGRAQLDFVGAALVTLGLIAVVLPLIFGREFGWPVWIWLCLVAALPLLLAFGGYQRRLSARGRAPLIDPALFRERTFTVGLLAVLVFWASMASFFLVLALYLQQGRGLSALAAGGIFSILGLGYFATSMSARHLTRWLGHRSLAIGAMAMAVGLGLLYLIVAQTGTAGSVLLLAPALLLDGAGMGLVVAPLTSTVLAGLPPRHAGAAAGVLSAMVQVGNSLGVALIGIIFYGIFYGSLAHSGPHVAYPRAFDASLIYLAVLAVATAVLVQLLLRERKPKRIRTNNDLDGIAASAEDAAQRRPLGERLAG